jgi:hypothetical protein
MVPATYLRPHESRCAEPFSATLCFQKTARLSSTCLLRVARNRYLVPCELAGQRVSTRLYPEHMHVVAADMLVASHERLTERKGKSEQLENVNCLSTRVGLFDKGIVAMRL